MARGWKRCREGVEGADHPQHVIRYSDLPPEVKLQKRRQERQERKEKERTLAYFISAHRALEEQSPETLATLVDGFFVDLIKLLRADSSLHLLRNGTVCRVVEAALSSSQLVHSKSLLYVLLGHVYDLASSPTASRTLEAILAGIVRGVNMLFSSDREAFSAEVTQGSGPGNGVPSASTLVTCVVEELAERAGDVLLHDSAARATRSIILFLGGFLCGVGTGPPRQHGVRFSAQLDMLGVALVSAVESTFCEGCDGGTADIWLQMAMTPTASFIVQSLFRVCEHGTRLDVVLRQHLEAIHNDGSQLLRRFLMHPLGCHVFQAYLKVPVPLPVLEACDNLSRQRRGGTVASLMGNEKRPRGILDTATSEVALKNDGFGLDKTCWDKALAIVVDALDDLITTTDNSTTHVVFALQDLVLFAPTAVHLEHVWSQLLERIGLRKLLASQKLVQVLVAFARKCAFANPMPAVVGTGESSAATVPLEGGFVGDVVPKDVEQVIYRDLEQGVRYFPTSSEFQKKFVTSVFHTSRELCPKGAAQFLLVDGGLEDRGFELARYIMHFVPSASAMFLHAVERLRRSDVEALLRHPKGSLVFQQFLRAGGAHHPQGEIGSEQQQQRDQAVKTIPLTFLRRISPLLAQLVGNTYAAYVVEVLYDVGNFEVKEGLVKALLPIYNGMRRCCGDRQSVEALTDQKETSDSTGNLHMSEFVTRKVMTKCFVEMYSHRPDDWAKLARRQCQVQRLLQRMSTVVF